MVSISRSRTITYCITFSKLYLYLLYHFLEAVSLLTVSLSRSCIFTYCITFSKLYLYPLAKRRKHFCKDDLFVPNRTIGVLLYTRSTLNTEDLKLINRTLGVLLYTRSTLNTEDLKTYKPDYRCSSSIVLIEVLELKTMIG